MVAGAELAAETRLDVVADAVPEAPVVSVQQQTLFCEEFWAPSTAPIMRRSFVVISLWSVRLFSGCFRANLPRYRPRT